MKKVKGRRHCFRVAGYVCKPCKNKKHHEDDIGNVGAESKSKRCKITKVKFCKVVEGQIKGKIKSNENENVEKDNSSMIGEVLDSIISAAVERGTIKIVKKQRREEKRREKKRREDRKEKRREERKEKRREERKEKRRTKKRTKNMEVLDSIISAHLEQLLEISRRNEDIVKTILSEVVEEVMEKNNVTSGNKRKVIGGTVYTSSPWGAPTFEKARVEVRSPKPDTVDISKQLLKEQEWKQSAKFRQQETQINSNRIQKDVDAHYYLERGPSNNRQCWGKQQKLGRTSTDKKY